ncbi:transcriptional regulator [Catellatospora sp. NPDC049609]|uniref:transcriptional regulator n=1 Tax=Catellatospora sp. NPDC049609 TaxID=3155505 RepID=UPI00343436C0
MHPLAIRRQARADYRAGTSMSTIAARLGLPYQTVRNWCRANSTDGVFTEDRCPRCRPAPGLPDPADQYAYLLGLYLGDGHLVTKTKVPVLRVYCDEIYPRLIEACEQAMLRTLAHSVQRVRQRGCVGVQSYGKHWPCLLPQAGPGRKHERRIALESWQEVAVRAHPGDFVRGLFHSDGCRVVNRVRKAGRPYEYPRYLFANESADILALCGWALDLLGVAWRLNRPNSLSVARREAVAVLDRHVGPKS